MSLGGADGLLVIIGGRGQLGADLLRLARERGLSVAGLGRADLDVADAQSVQRALDGLRPGVVVNTAAAHGAGFDQAPDQRPFFAVNALGAWNLARWCARRDTLIIHFSTDYVFGAEAQRAEPYREGDTLCPVNVYGASKAAGEMLVRSFCSRHYVLRVSALYGMAGCRAKQNSNFVKMTLGKIRRGEDMQVVADQFVSPTWTRAAAGKMYGLLEARAPYGLYHLAGRGACSWHEFAVEIARLAGAGISVQPVTTPSELPEAPFRRPRYTALDNAALRAAGLPDLPPWQDSLATYLREEERVG